jgi:hypothetical protein
MTEAPAPAVFCGHCGRGLDETDHETCHAKLQLEPPRYCPRCRRRMVVQVVPRGWRATCVEHGTSSGG